MRSIFRMTSSETAPRTDCRPEDAILRENASVKRRGRVRINATRPGEE